MVIRLFKPIWAWQYFGTYQNILYGLRYWSDGVFAFNLCNFPNEPHLVLCGVVEGSVYGRCVVVSRWGWGVLLLLRLVDSRLEFSTVVLPSSAYIFPSASTSQIFALKNGFIAQFLRQSQLKVLLKIMKFWAISEVCIWAKCKLETQF